MKRARKRIWIKRLFLATLAAGFLALVAGISVFAYYASTLPRPERFTEMAFPQSTQIYDRTGTALLYEIRGEEKRVRTNLQDIPDELEHAVIVAEDQAFYSHFGFDVSGIVRSILMNIRRGELVQGGSTITQQLARSAFLTREKSLDRKVKEAVLTLDLELRYGKEEVLEFYLNQIPLGSNVYGVGAAAEFYFDKPVRELSLKESATIAAMIRAPSYYSPFRAERSAERETLVATILDRMASSGYISQERADDAKEERLAVADQSVRMKAPHFILDVLESLREEYGDEYLRSNGLRVTTTLDWELQKAAEAAIAQYAPRNELAGAHNAALVALDPRRGEILALVGSKDWSGDSSPAGCIPGETCLFDPKVNVATALPGRQPGSAFKPFVYTRAFEKGASDDTVVIDEETNFGVWGGEEYIPQNYDEKFRGEVTLREALAQSMNVPAVKVLLDLAGLEESIETAKEMGITTLGDPSRYGPAIVLGAGEVRLLDMVSAYGTLATEGRRVPPLSILRVETQGGSVLEQNAHAGITVIEPSAARLVTDILSDNEARAPLFGGSSPLYIPDYPVAVKTGTTQNNRDAWTVGYSPRLAAGVWVGNSNDEPMNKVLGVMVSSPMWRAFMDAALPRIYPSPPTP